jgi:hypothetical protein
MNNAEKFRDFMLADLKPSTFDPKGLMADVLRDFVKESYNAFAGLEKKELDWGDLEYGKDT